MTLAGRRPFPLLPLLFIVCVLAGAGAPASVEDMRIRSIGRRLAALEPPDPAAWSKGDVVLPAPVLAVEPSGRRRWVQALPDASLPPGSRTLLVLGGDRLVLTEDGGRVTAAWGRAWSFGAVLWNSIQAFLVLLSLLIVLFFAYFLIKVIVGIPGVLRDIAAGILTWISAVAMAVFLALFSLFIIMVLLPGLFSFASRMAFTQRVTVAPQELLVQPRLFGFALPERRLDSSGTTLIAVGKRDRVVVLAVYPEGSWPLFDLPSGETGQVVGLNRILQSTR